VRDEVALGHVSVLNATGLIGTPFESNIEQSEQSFDLLLLDNKPSKHFVANVNFEGTEAIWCGLCKM
jgi:hypothetical protein